MVAMSYFNQLYFFPIIVSPCVNVRTKSDKRDRERESGEIEKIPRQTERMEKEENKGSVRESATDTQAER